MPDRRLLYILTAEHFRIKLEGRKMDTRRRYYFQFSLSETGEFRLWLDLLIFHIANTGTERQLTLNKRSQADHLSGTALLPTNKITSSLPSPGVGAINDLSPESLRASWSAIAWGGGCSQSLTKTINSVAGMP